MRYFHPTSDSWVRLTGPAEPERDLTKVADYIATFKDDIQELIQFAWLSPILFQDKGICKGIGFECTPYSEGQAAKFVLKFPDAFRANVVAKREHHAIDPETGIVRGFAERYQESAAVREYYPSLFMSFKGEQPCGPITIHVLEEIVGVGGKPDFRAQPYAEAIKVQETFQRLVDQMYLAALAISSDGFALTDVRPVHANNVIMEAGTGRFRLFDTDKLVRTKYSTAANMLLFLESSLVNPDLSGTAHLLDDEDSSRFAMAIIQKYEGAFPHDLMQNGSFEYGTRFTFVEPGKESQFPEQELLRGGQLGSLSAYHQITGRYPNAEEVAGLAFRKITPAYTFFPDAQIIGAAILGDVGAFRERLRELKALGQERTLV